MTDEIELQRLVNRVAMRAGMAAVAPVANANGRGFVAASDGVKASVRKGSRTTEPTPGFDVPRGRTFAVGEPVWYYELGSDRRIVDSADRGGGPTPPPPTGVELPWKVVETSSVNDAAAMQDAMDALAADGGGTILLRAGTYRLGATVVVPHTVNVWGMGKSHPGAGTILLLTAADAGLAFGTRTTGGRGGLSGNFSIDADGIATDPFYVGLTVERTFQDIAVMDAAAGGAGIRVEGGQNNLFLGVTTQDGLDDGWVLDYGCGGNAFVRCGVSGHAGYNLRVMQSGTSPAGTYSVPTHNGFYHAVVERAPVAGNLGQIRIEAGFYTSFTDCVLASSSTVTGYAMFEMTGVASALIHGGLIQANVASHVTGIKLATGAALTIDDTMLSGHLYGFDIAASANVLVGGGLRWTNVTNHYTSTSNNNSRVTAAFVNPVVTTREAVTDWAFASYVTELNGQPFYQDAMGGHHWVGFPGTGYVADTHLDAPAAGTLRTRGRHLVTGDVRIGVVDTPPAAADLYRGSLLVIADPTGAAADTLQLGAKEIEVVTAADDFARSVSGGWGTPTTGPAWVRDSGTAGDFSVDGASGLMASAAGAGAAADLMRVPVGILDTEVRASLALDAVPTDSVDASLYSAEVRMRRLDASNRYSVVVYVRATGAVNLRLHKVVAGVDTTLTQVTVAGLTYTADTVLHLHAMVTGTAPNVLRASIWEDGDSEPAGWLLEYSETNAALDSVGDVSLNGFLTSTATNGPITIAWDDLRVVEPTYAWTEVGASGGVGGAPSGAAGGELAGTYPDPTVATTHSGSAHHDPVTVGTGLDVSGQLVTLDLSEVAAGGELAGNMDAPTVAATHSGSTHAATQAAAESTAATALAATAPDIQIFGAGAGQSWAMPAGAVAVKVLCCGAGGGGGSGRRGAATTENRSGGGGAGGGGWSEVLLRASDLTSPINVTVAAGAAGGGAKTGDNLDGAVGSHAGDTFFGPTAATAYVSAGGGQRGGAGVNGTASGGTGSQGKGMVMNPSAVGYGGHGINGTNGTPAAVNAFGGGPTRGGGGGGGLNTSNTEGTGGDGGMSGLIGLQTLAGTGGAARNNGHDGNTAPFPGMPGGSGGGGGAGGTAAAGAGGNGGPGCGGGGGGGSTNGYNSGAGGNGGDGFVVVVSYR